MSEMLPVYYLLSEAGCDPNAQEHVHGLASLHVAAWAGNMELLVTLLEKDRRGEWNSIFFSSFFSFFLFICSELFRFVSFRFASFFLFLLFLYFYLLMMLT
jgi:hypothetical protein